METHAIKGRLWLARILALMGLVLLVCTYLLGPLYRYADPITGDTEIDEENLSFQPFSFLIPEGTETVDPSPELVQYLGDELYVYFPAGLEAALVGYNTMPIWRVSLEAPQYPKASYPEGIPVFFTLTDFRGRVVEMNVINHYIGMVPMDVGAFKVRKLVPFVYLTFFLMILIYLFYSGPGWWVLGMVPALMPWYFIGFFSYWLYWFGHNLHDYGAFQIKPFMPTVLGDGKVAQFVTHSYPTVGFYFLLGVFVCLGLSVLIKRRALREKAATS
ncbi:cytochrome C [Deltaproteobacteria bacterium TL4]